MNDGQSGGDSGPKQKSPSISKRILSILGIILLFSIFNSVIRGCQAEPNQLSYTEFIKEVENGNVSRARVSRDRLSISLELKTIRALPEQQKLVSPPAIQAKPPQNNAGEAERPAPIIYRVFLLSPILNDGELYSKLQKAGVEISAENSEGSVLTTFLVTMLPMLLFIGVWIFFMRRQTNMMSNIQSQIGKAKARLWDKDSAPSKRFKDVAGCDEAKEELREFVEFLKNPSKFHRLGGEMPKGVLLTGPPGCGKTLLAKAVAGEAGVPFFSMSGSDFVEMFVGTGASRVRDLFGQAKQRAPCIIFVDEIDAVGRHRGAGLGGGHDEREQTLNQLLVEMDGFEALLGVVLLAATNRPDILDAALLRPGRFDRQVVVQLPDIKGREEILKIHAADTKMSPEINFTEIARLTPGASGADLANITNEAAILAARDQSERITQEHLERAVDKTIAGVERKSAVIPPRVKKITAFHESGHTLVGAILHQKDPQSSDPVHKVSIIPRGQALGITQQLPEEDAYMHSKKYLLNRLAVLMAGRTAEVICFGKEQISTGAGDDIKRATEIARKMICEWGMSDRLGPIAYGNRQEMLFLGREIDRKIDYSEETAEAIDKEIRVFVDRAEKDAEEILNKYSQAFVKITEALLEKENLSGIDVSEIITNNPPR